MLFNFAKKHNFYFCSCENINQEHIGKFIAECRKKQLTQEDLAERLGVSNKTISKWGNAKCMDNYSSSLNSIFESNLSSITAYDEVIYEKGIDLKGLKIYH